MKKYIGFSFIVLITFCAISCNNALQNNNYKDNDLRFSLKKGACFGQCPVFELKIYHNRYSVLIGEMNSDKIGQYDKTLSKEDFTKIEKAFKSLDFDSFPDQFKSNIQDLPLIEIGYHNGKEFRIVAGKEDRPEDLMQVQFLLEKVVDNKEWNFVKSLDEINKDKAPEPVFIYNEIIIEPKKGLLLPKWIESYNKYGVRIINKVAPTLDYYLIGFDSKKIAPKDFIELLYKDSDIKSAEFNKKTSLRDQE